MNPEHITRRLHDALHRGHRKATKEKLAEVTAVVLDIVTEVTAEMAEVIAALAVRVEAPEATVATRCAWASSPCGSQP